MNFRRTIARGSVIAIALIAFMGARVSWAGDSTDCLGSALAFSLFSFADDGDIEIGVGNGAKVTSSLCFLSGEIGAGGDIVLGNNGLYTGDAVSFGAITLNNYAKVLGAAPLMAIRSPSRLRVQPVAARTPPALTACYGWRTRLTSMAAHLPATFRLARRRRAFPQWL